MTMKVLELRAENFKRLKVVKFCPTGAVTPIVGKNGAGKTSTIDAIAAALGGGDYSPDLPIRRGAEGAEVIVDLGDIIVTRTWKAGKAPKLEVSSRDGAKFPSPQAMLDKLVGQLTFDPLAFGRMKPTEQAAQFAKLAGIDLAGYTAKRKAVFDNRTTANKIHRDNLARLTGMPEVDAPDSPISINDLVAELQKARAINDKADKAEQAVTDHQTKLRDVSDRIKRQNSEVERIRKSLSNAEAELTKLAGNETNLNTYTKGIEETARKATRVDLSEIESKIQNADEVNVRVRAKQERQSLADRVAAMSEDCDKLTAQIDEIDASHQSAVSSAKLPVPGLAFNADGVTLDGIPFAQCSGSERLRTSVAVGLALNPKLKLMLIRDGSLLDSDGMALLTEMAEKADAQILIERVDNGSEIGIHIVDGESVEAQK